ncbi:cytochrome c oxidase assembly protein [Thalassiella azotivora]
MTDAGPDGWWVPALVLVVPLLGLGLTVRRRRGRLGRGWSRWRVASAVTGVALVAVAVSPPLVHWGHTDPRGHMVQHLLLGMYAPLALVLAAPVTLLLGALRPRTARRVGRVLASRPVHVFAHPVTAGLLSTGGLFVLYLTDLYALSTRAPLVHWLVAAHLLVAGSLFAWAVAGPDPAPRRPGTATRVVVLLVSAGAHAVLAKTLYARAGELPPGVPVVVEQAEQAARWMYYGGDVAEVLLACALLAGWSRRAAGRARGVPVPGGPAERRRPGVGVRPSGRALQP